MKKPRPTKIKDVSKAIQTDGGRAGTGNRFLPLLSRVFSVRLDAETQPEHGREDKASPRAVLEVGEEVGDLESEDLPWDSNFIPFLEIS